MAQIEKYGDEINNEGFLVNAVLTNKKKIILASILIVLVGIRLYLPIFALHYINKELNLDPNYRGSIDAVHLHLWRGAYAADNLVLKRVQGQKTFPFVEIDIVEVGLSWKDLFNRAIVARVKLTHPIINIVAEPKEPSQPSKVAIGGASKAEKKTEVKTWHEVFKDLIPLDVSRLLVDSGSVHFRDLTSNPKLDVYVDRIEVIGQNLTNSAKVSKSLSGEIDLKARAMKSGAFTVKVQLNPTANPLETKINIKLEKLALTNLNELFTAYGKFNVKKGTLDFYSEVAIARNTIKGYVKPLIKDLEVADFKVDIKKGIGHALWEEVVGAAGFLLKNHSKDEQGVRVPFEGRLDQPKVETWPAIVSVFQNIFIKALPPGLEHTVKLSDVKK